MPRNQNNLEILKANVALHFEQISVQLSHADKVNGRAKSGYYKVAILLAAAAAEALAHAVLRAKLDNGATPPLGQWECFESHNLPLTHQPQRTNYLLSICKRRQPIFRLTEKTDFARVNAVCKDLGVFSTSFYNKIERVRTLRNRIHLQSLTEVDRSYNKQKLDSIGFVINKLIDKLPSN